MMKKRTTLALSLAALVLLCEPGVLSGGKAHAGRHESADSHSDELKDPTASGAPDPIGIDVGAYPYREVAKRLARSKRVRVYLEGERHPLLLVRPKLTAVGLVFDRGKFPGDAVESPVDLHRVSRIEEPGSHAGRGAGIGFALGAIGGGATFGALSTMSFGLGSGGSSDVSGGAIAVGVILGGTVGALLGAAVGAAIPKWTTVYPRRGWTTESMSTVNHRSMALELALLRDGRLGLGTTVRF